MSSAMYKKPSIFKRITLVVEHLPIVWASTALLQCSLDGSQAPDPSLPGCYINSSPERSTTLFDMDKLGIPHEQRAMFQTANRRVRDYMYGDKYDPSHDYEHIQRVVALAQHLYLGEQDRNLAWASTVDLLIVWLACMFHDVGEPKYREDAKTQEQVICEILQQCGVSDATATKVAFIAKAVSFTYELTHRDEIRTLIPEYPELALVQDADRLDALGAIGTVRASVFGGANEVRKKQTIHAAI
ncbi:hypothetical protein BDV95DRAFT_599536 [Massariosphaeria phaeospora]|uniref:HD/PDEase domain-containing protein n=1 Tax=Massariosphaeria phaeospora TaxID=100035 RepID=A0A7C8HYX7_9PLEO|nr:hypothetical protein BDV95DRAFT_599536 [Massariosphaeria phaeospora]